ncbi:protein-tyrosine phosphatase [Defluviimonas sp. 20V17]|uniref:Protein-tyrosine-phosphatase n=1 Tax=Allgaiera indica TaxID=765699 RepID=A0AAN4ZY98_9RHOB|nr:hypothetical protein [Allgaiera indica]KDB04504.1 protein-tyrosine phosphatase [Defluviimonas sp. 20V17]GHD99787.1 protein-tyrosine-phosphatase [Allgaiera indica]SDW18270.1 Predicted protein tyrosine phosphatase [Allgaiera indica]
MRVLFICSSNLIRSPTAERHFADRPGIETMSAGVGSDAIRPLTAALVTWADLILTMEEGYADQVRDRFADELSDTPMVSLDVPDRFKRDGADLKALLECRCRKWFCPQSQ